MIKITFSDKARVVVNLFKRSLLCSAATPTRASLRPDANIEQLYEKSQKLRFRHGLLYLC
ncbi:hypothetical protein VAL01S_07_01640 [Vibrio alginolyticus NBRC 15630 = ATCC 17749]|nr:hypothetical protein YZOS03_40300 [Vibrio alginolyticus]GAD71367.1 hypothetical protein VAL01S_07_01640 [Vibrio alginolyticus NBRC 15630 = ATCC 17749]